jgi:isoquinoline 1-oxidoreductase alpha subunit
LATITVNGVLHDLENVDVKMPLLWYLREKLGLMGTKFGCGMAMCGACTVLIEGDPVRSCVTKVQSVSGSVTTIEGLGANKLHPVQEAWLEIQVPQCGYCQSGQILLAAGLLAQNPHPTAADVDAYMDQNICRCGTYNEIRAAVLRAAEIQSAGNGT